MKSTISHGGAAITAREYEVRFIDECGDAQEVDHYDNKKQAVTAAKDYLNSNAKAAVLELHVSRRPSHLFGSPDTFTIIATFGDVAALRAGDWID